MATMGSARMAARRAACTCASLSSPSRTSRRTMCRTAGSSFSRSQGTASARNAFRSPPSDYPSLRRGSPGRVRGAVPERLPPPIGEDPDAPVQAALVALVLLGVEALPPGVGAEVAVRLRAVVGKVQGAIDP